jgi:hypothetical protein
VREEQMRHAEAEAELLSIYLMGDIREDAQFMGLTLKDMGWIIGTTLTIGLVPFLLPFSFWVKLIWLVLVMGTSFIGRAIRLPYRRKRYYLDKRYQPKHGTGTGLETLLGMEEDSWFYISKNKSGRPVVQMLYSIQAPPWETAILSQKRQRIAAFGQFIRACSKEGFTIDVFAEQIPDYRHDIWAQKVEAASDSEGIEQLKMMRIGMWRGLAQSGEAQRSAYVLRLTIDQHRIDPRQRDDEPEGSKEELKRFRFVAELREKQARVMNVLGQSGHLYSLISGYVTPELLGRWWDRKAWERWTDLQESWQELEDEQQQSLVMEQQELEVEHIELEDPDVPPVVDEEPITTKKSAFRSHMTGLRTSVGAVFSRLRVLIAKRLRKRKAKTEGADAVALADEDERLEEATESLLLTPGVRLLTSPVPSGKTFLAVNLGTAWSSHETPVHVVDLSPDQGCKTALNPLPLTSREEGWESYMSRHAPGLTLWIPTAGFRHTDAVKELLHKLGPSHPVLVDLPWGHPDREELQAHGIAVAIVDSDYHHWLRWEQAAPRWMGEVWINGAEPEMQQAVRTLVKEQWQPAECHLFPAVKGARHWLYQGRPPATDPDIRQLLRQTGDTQEEEGCA